MYSRSMPTVDDEVIDFKFPRLLEVFASYRYVLEL
jgi:hypothetical protein